MNQRLTVRYTMRAPVIFSWRLGEHRWAQGAGFTRDLSTRGTYVMCDKADRPPMGTQVWFQVLLPSFEVKSEGVRLKSLGTVVRMGSPTESGGFAISASLDPESAEDSEMDRTTN